MRRSRSLVLGATLIALALFAAACGSGEDDDDGGAGEEQRGSVTVGVSGAFTENQLLAEMYAQALENVGYDVSRQLEIGSREISQPALVDGEIDIKPEYLASLLLFLDPKAEASGIPEENVSVLEPLLAEQGVALLEPSPATDQN
ncbi:MAG: glycine betaine ABC transporter substrate-binding protein, partial [Actinomycetota bacterium]